MARNQTRLKMWLKKKNKKTELSESKIEEQFRHLETPILDMPFATPDVNKSASMKKVRDTYSVGYIDGDTVVKLTCGDLTLALTMSPSEVRRMIRLLKATLDDTDDENTQHNVTSNSDQPK